jgi:hypothetical protein
MAIDSRALINELTTAASTRGLFDSVNGHEPKAAPPRSGVSCAVWWSGLNSVRSSGLGALSVRVQFTMRIYTSMLQEPQDAIDPAVMDAADALFAYLAADFEISGQARYVDLLGSDGEPMGATPGYLTQDGKVFRTVDIMVPVIINDAYPLSA